MNAPPPLGLLAELTHRCPLQCPYCSNPLELLRQSEELSTDAWLAILDQAAALGVLQVHFSGGEPMVRADLARLVRRATDRGLYANLITSGVLLNAGTLDTLVAAGLPHVQISFQDIEATGADRLAGYPGGLDKKIAAARLVRAAGLSLTANFVIHRENTQNVADMIALAQEMGVQRIEVAHVQYYGWALLNRSALLPSRAQLDAVTAIVEQARIAHAGQFVIDYVIPDYYAKYPKPCMAGWARRFFTVTPAGAVLPCHAAQTITSVPIPSIRNASLLEIWNEAPLFNLYRGTDWMRAPCRDCERREIDWGGCRCQALALTGDAAATDPVCVRSPDRSLVDAALEQAAQGEAEFSYRRYHSPSGSISA